MSSTRTLLKVGDRYGHLTVIGEGVSKPQGSQKKKAMCSPCRCDCGKQTTPLSSALRKGKIVSCGCFRGSWLVKPPGVSALNRAVYSVKAGAILRKIPWLLTDEEVKVLVVSPCHWCGAVRVNNFGKSGQKLKGIIGWNGLDRLDNNGVYSTSNVVPCCGPCNRMKGQQTVSDFIERCRRIIAKHSSV